MILIQQLNAKVQLCTSAHVGRQEATAQSLHSWYKAHLVKVYNPFYYFAEFCWILFY
jgi:hypothetical protein